MFNIKLIVENQRVYHDFAKPSHFLLHSLKKFLALFWLKLTLVFLLEKGKRSSDVWFLGC